MPRFEYKVVPAPRKGLKAKGVKSPEERFAHALATLMNTEARDGWEYQRTDTLPMLERKGLTGSTTSYQNMVVFRRALSEAAASLTPGTMIEATQPPALVAAPPAEVEFPSNVEPRAPKLVARAEEGDAPRIGPASASADDDDPDAHDRTA